MNRRPVGTQKNESDLEYWPLVSISKDTRSDAPTDSSNCLIYVPKRIVCDVSVRLFSLCPWAFAAFANT